MDTESKFLSTCEKNYPKFMMKVHDESNFTKIDAEIVSCHLFKKVSTHEVDASNALKSARSHLPWDKEIFSLCKQI